MTKPLFTASLIVPQGYVCQFKVYSAGLRFWEFINENLGLSILLFYVHDVGYFGSLMPGAGNEIQKDNLICQAVFELEEFYRKRH